MPKRGVVIPLITDLKRRRSTGAATMKRNTTNVIPHMGIKDYAGGLCLVEVRARRMEPDDPVRHVLIPLGAFVFTGLMEGQAELDERRGKPDNSVMMLEAANSMRERYKF